MRASNWRSAGRLVCRGAERGEHRSDFPQQTRGVGSLRASVQLRCGHVFLRASSPLAAADAVRPPPIGRSLAELSPQARPATARGDHAPAISSLGTRRRNAPPADSRRSGLSSLSAAIADEHERCPEDRMSGFGVVHQRELSLLQGVGLPARWRFGKILEGRCCQPHGRV
jgi:hypothetical protein